MQQVMRDKEMMSHGSHLLLALNIVAVADHSNEVTVR
jgi:hypothetical protein